MSDYELAEKLQETRRMITGLRARRERRGHARNAPAQSPCYDQIMVFFAVYKAITAEQDLRGSECKM